MNLCYLPPSFETVYCFIIDIGLFVTQKEKYVISLFFMLSLTFDIKVVSS